MKISWAFLFSTWICFSAVYGQTRAQASIVILIHADGNYSFQDRQGLFGKPGAIQNSQEVFLQNAQEMAKSCLGCEVFIFYQIPRAFHSFQRVNEKMFIYQDGKLAHEKWLDRGDEAEIYSKYSMAVQDSKTAFVYAGHGPNAFEWQVLSESGADIFQNSQIDLLALVSCEALTVSRLPSLRTMAKHVVGSPTLVHPELFDLSALIQLAGDQADVKLISEQVAQDSFEQHSQNLQMEVVFSAVNLEETSTRVYYRPPTQGPGSERSDHSGWIRR